MPRSDELHEALVRCSSDEESPVVRVNLDARIVYPTALDVPTRQDLRNLLQAFPILLRVLHVQPRLGISWHSTIGIEVPTDIVETFESPGKCRGFVCLREEFRRCLKDPEVALLTLPVDPASMSEDTKNQL